MFFYFYFKLYKRQEMTVFLFNKRYNMLIYIKNSRIKDYDFCCFSDIIALKQEKCFLKDSKNNQNRRKYADNAYICKYEQFNIYYYSQYEFFYSILPNKI